MMRISIHLAFIWPIERLKIALMCKCVFSLFCVAFFLTIERLKIALMCKCVFSLFCVAFFLTIERLKIALMCKCVFSLFCVATFLLVLRADQCQSMNIFMRQVKNVRRNILARYWPMSYVREKYYQPKSRTLTLSFVFLLIHLPGFLKRILPVCSLSLFALSFCLEVNGYFVNRWHNIYSQWTQTNNSDYPLIQGNTLAKECVCSHACLRLRDPWHSFAKEKRIGSVGLLLNKLTWFSCTWSKRKISNAKNRANVERLWYQY